MNYDPVADPYGQFVYKIANAAGENEFWIYSGAFGLATSHTGPNGLATTWSYDGFGRKTREHRPDTTEDTDRLRLLHRPAGRHDRDLSRQARLSP